MLLIYVKYGFLIASSKFQNLSKQTLLYSVPLFPKNELERVEHQVWITLVVIRLLFYNKNSVKFSVSSLICRSSWVFNNGTFQYFLTTHSLFFVRNYKQLIKHNYPQRIINHIFVNFGTQDEWQVSRTFSNTNAYCKNFFYSVSVMQNLKSLQKVEMCR